VPEAGRSTRLSPWGRVVLASAILVLGAIVGLVASELTTRREELVSYPVGGAVAGLSFDIGDAAIEVVGGGTAREVDVQRRERSAFGHAPQTTRSVAGGTFLVRSRCPTELLASCRVRYRLVVPDNLPIEIRTDGGEVRFRGYRGSATVTTQSGDIDIADYCGFSLDARAESGDIETISTCPPQRLSLRAGSGAVHAVVPSGPYRVDAESSSGRNVVRGITATTEAPFSIQALSSSGDVVVEGRR
jgi:Putative adhesin